MSKNEGKKFEEDFKNSIPSDIWFRRLKDQPGMFFKKDENSYIENEDNLIRFTQKSDYDFEIFNGIYLYCLELKSINLRNLPYTKIKPHQIEVLEKNQKFKNMICGFIINFRKYEKTYFLNIDDFLNYKKNNSARSISIDSVVLYNGILINQTKIRIRYRYDLSLFC